MKKRAIIMVIDSMGIGAMDDYAEFNDVKECNTLKNVCEFNNGLDVPVMEAMGLGNIQDFKGIKKTATPIGQYGTLIEKYEDSKEDVKSSDLDNASNSRTDDVFAAFDKMLSSIISKAEEDAKRSITKK